MPLIPEREPRLVTDEEMLKGPESLLFNDRMSSLPTTINEDESFLTFEQKCKIDSKIFIDRPQQKITREIIVTAVLMDGKMEEDYPKKKKILYFNNKLMKFNLRIWIVILI